MIRRRVLGSFRRDRSRAALYRDGRARTRRVRRCWRHYDVQRLARPYQEIAAGIARRKQLGDGRSRARAATFCAVMPVIELTPSRRAKAGCAAARIPPPAGSSGFFAGLFSAPAPVAPATVNPWAKQDRD